MTVGHITLPRCLGALYLFVLHTTFTKILLSPSTSSFSNLRQNQNQTLGQFTESKGLSPIAFNGSASSTHIVFVVGCEQNHRHLYSSAFQLSALRSLETSPITSVICGCSEEQQQAIRAEVTFYPNYHLHFAPDRSVNAATDDYYSPYNKPFGLQHWLDHSTRPITASAIVLTDADFVLLRPFQVNVVATVEEVLNTTESSSVITISDGMGMGHSSPEFKESFWSKTGEFPELYRKVCREDKCLEVTEQQAREEYSVGPPYVLTTRDWHKIIADYGRMTQLARVETQVWVVEMHGYALAAANQDIKHRRSGRIGASHPNFESEDWAFLDGFDMNPCIDAYLPSWSALYSNGVVAVPHGLHYCQIYNGGALQQDSPNAYVFYKHYIKQDIATCAGGFLEDFPRDLWTVNQQSHKEIWMACSVINTLNDALFRIKQTTCPDGFTTGRTVSFKQDRR